MLVKIKRLCQDATIPTYGTIDSAGADLYSCMTSSHVILPGEQFCVPTGISIEMPSGYFCVIVPRSGLALKNGITILNSPGIIDQDYRGEIKCILLNTSKIAFEVTNKMRIAQLVMQKSEIITFEESSELSKTQRDTSGFGSTGLF